MVPRIYYAADWPGIADGKIDLLAIDRNGVGDAHLVEIRRTAKEAVACAPRLLAGRAPYRWVAYFRDSQAIANNAEISNEHLYIPGSPGRIGLIEIAEQATDELIANVRLTAERFATPVYEMATSFSNTHEAQIQFDG